MTAHNDFEVLKRARSFISHDEHGHYLAGPFENLQAELLINGKRYPNHKALDRSFKRIVQDLWNIGTLTHRLVWFQQWASDDEARHGQWRNYASVDIEHFNIEVRSIMDYTAQVIGLSYRSGGQMPDSFRRLYARVDKYKKHLDAKAVQLIKGATWFFEVRTIRNATVHGGGQTIVFGRPQEGILFQVFREDFDRLIHRPFLMHNTNVVCFDRYAALYISHLLVFLNDLAICVGKKIGAPNSNQWNAKSYSGGFDVLSRWIDALMHQLDG